MKKPIRMSPRVHSRDDGIDSPAGQRSQPTGAARRKGSGPATGPNEGRSPANAAGRPNDQATTLQVAICRPCVRVPWITKGGAAT
jgi:hypothetical protein